MLLRWFFIYALILGLSIPAQAFERRIGARPLGMGDAFLALADDMNTLNYNPAGLALGRNIEISMEYANLYPGLDDGVIQENHLVYTQSLYDSGGFGIGWNNRSVVDVYMENEFILGYAIRPEARWPLWLGLTAKLFYLSYTDPQTRDQNTYFADGFDKFQFGFDLGGLCEIISESKNLPGIRAGFSLLNLNQPDLGLYAESKQPWEFRFGGSVVYGEWDGALDLVYSDSRFQVHTGAEKWFLNRQWGLRAGVIAGEGTGLTGTMGGSYTLDLQSFKMRMNYAFNYSFGGIRETAGTQRLSLDFLYPLPTRRELQRKERKRQRGAKIEFEKNRKSAFALYEKTRARLVRLEYQPVYKYFMQEVQKLKADTQQASTLMNRLKYIPAIQLLEEINISIKKLETRYRGERKERTETKKKEASRERVRVMKRADLIRRVKIYLKRKILQYASVRQKIKRLRRKVDAKYDSGLYAAENMIYTARNRIVKHRDIRGFLRNLKRAIEKLKQVESEIEKDQMIGIR